MTTVQTLQDGLLELLGTGEISESCVDDLMDNLLEVRSFADADILTSNAGLVISLADGSEFQITIVKSG